MLGFAMLESSFSLQRQKRLLDAIADEGLDAVVIGWTPHFYYFTAFRPFWLHEAALILFADGKTIAITPNEPAKAAADDVVAFEASKNSTQRQDQPAAIAEIVVNELRLRQAKAIGVDTSAVNLQVQMRWDTPCRSIDDEIWQLRRRKDPDELALMRKAFACVDAMYRKAREIVEPGIDEIRLFSELNAAALAEAGEPLSALLGNDYRCNAKGGPPTGGKLAKAGEIYIIDVGPAYRGYFSDASRGFVVGKKPTDAQLFAQETLVKSHAIVAAMARPGARCAEIYEAVDEQLKDAVGRGLPHHLGHGVGLQPHEYPHLNPRWDDVLIEGEIVTAEPGIYGPELSFGIRLENAYLVKPDGLESLVSFPMELS
jgi:Xaa-Pro aminopeptidase